MFPEPTNQAYLLEHQYRNSSNLDARIQLHLRFSTAPGTLAEWYFGFLSAGPEARTLDVGCGHGSLWAEGRAFIQPGWSITLADLSPGMLQDAREQLAGVEHPFQFCVADAQDLPFPAQSFDAVMANFMLYHVPNREKVYDEVRRVLKLGGHFHAATVGRDHMRQLDELVAAINPAVRTRSPLAFTVESGMDELRSHFGHVELHVREDALEVTDPEAIVRYTQSGRGRLDESGVAELRRRAETEMATRGAMHIDKAMGLFIAWDDG